MHRHMHIDGIWRRDSHLADPASWDGDCLGRIWGVGLLWERAQSRHVATGHQVEGIGSGACADDGWNDSLLRVSQR